MPDRLLRKRFVAVKIQPTPGTDPVPTITDVIICGEPKINPQNANFVKRKNYSGAMGSTGSVMTSKNGTLNMPMELVGSGVAATAPQHGKLMRASGCSETILAAAATGTAQAGSTTTTIKLAVGASAVDDAYQGMLIATTGGTGPGQERIIIDYNGTSKVATVNDAWTITPDATTTYSIAPQVAYNPVSTITEQVAAYYNDNGLLHKILDIRGNIKFSLVVNDVPTVEFNGIGLPASRAQTDLTGTRPTIPKPSAVLTANSGQLHVFGTLYSFKEFTVDMGAQPDHSVLSGAESITIKDRMTVAHCVIEVTAAQEDTLRTAIDAGTLGSIWMTHGTGAGNRHVFSITNGQLINPTSDEINSKVLFGFDVDVQPSGNLNDEVSYALV